MKRWVPAAMLAVLLLLVCGASAATDRGPYFSDVEEDDPCYPYIVELARAGTLSGYGDGTFRSASPVSRRELMEHLLAAIGADGASLEEAAVEHRLVYWFDAETPDEPVTRLEAAQMAARALDLLPMAGESPYADCDDGYVVKLWEKGIWDSGERFRPEDAMTRGDLAALLWHMARADLSEGAFRYSNYWVEELEGVALCDLDSSAFVHDAGTADYTGADCTTLQGVDVSGFQGEIDWTAVRADGIDFAMIRAGGRFMQSGGIYDDSFFDRNMTGALEAGLRVGVYFFSQAVTAEEGEEEAEYLLSRMEGYEVTMPVVIDWEYLGGSDSRVYGVEPAQVTAAIRVFCDRIRAAGYEPMVYINSYCGYIKIDLRRLADVKLWFAQYAETPTFRYRFDMWQYTNGGQVDGINGDVDRNLYFQK